MKIKKINNVVFMILISLVYLFISVIFNFDIWRDVVKPAPDNILAIQGESPIYEYVAETVRLNILSGKNPFEETKNVMYPFGWNYLLDDDALVNGFYFLLLRPFLNSHQSLMLIMLLGIFLASITMFLLLKKIGIHRILAFLFGLIYGFTPFISHRVGGHPTYTALYFFPLFGLLFYSILDKNNKNKIFYSILLGLLISITVLTNLYYCVMIFILFFVLLFFFLLYFKYETLVVIKKYFKYFFIAIISSIIFLYPWLIKVYKFLSTSSYAQPSNLPDPIPYSADIFNIFLPSRLNPIYKPLLKYITGYFPFVKYIFEDFIYPGLVILICYMFVLFIYKKLPKIIQIYFWTSLVFLILTFGPYLKILGKNLLIPLPFLFLYRIPFIQLARAPGRFVVIFVFLSCIVSAYIINYLLQRKILNKNVIFLLIFLIFIIDQLYLGYPGAKIKLPLKIYKYIQSNNSGSVLDIPSTLRDGLRSVGYMDGIWQPNAQLLHKQPIYGFYAGRINNDIFDYYKKNYLFGTIDELVNKKNSLLVRNLDYSKFADSLDFFDVHNVILNKDEYYAKEIESFLLENGFRYILDDDNYSLYYKNKIIQKEFLKVDLSLINNDLLYEGWYDSEKNLIWSKGKISKVIFKTTHVRPMVLKLKAKTVVKPQKVQVYINGHDIGKLIIKDNKTEEYVLDLDNKLIKGINIITLKSKHSYILGELIGNKKDLRNVSLNIKSLAIEDKK
jgi:hypothetical protein